MKSYLTLILFAVIMAFATGLLALKLKGPSTPISVDIGEFIELKDNFQRYAHPLSMVDFGNLYRSQEFQSLIRPLSSLHPFETRIPEDKTDYASNKHCFEFIHYYLNFENYEKMWAWEQFRCGVRKNLPVMFFNTAPYLHASGSSFAYLAVQSEKQEYTSESWILNHLSFFHVEELPKIKNKLSKLNNTIYDILVSLDTRFLKEIFEGHATIITDRFVFFKVDEFFLAPNLALKYRVYLRAQFDDFLADTNYSATVADRHHNQDCLFKEDNICWKYNSTHLYQLATQTTFYFFMGSLAIVCLVLWQILNKMRSDKRTEEKNRLALQVLTHEFRTPISSMLLQVEDIDQHFDSLHPDVQEAFLRLSEDVYRLQRLTEKSRYYLRTEHDKRLFRYNFKAIPSVNEFLENLLARYEINHPEKIIFTPLSKDISFGLDVYWLDICVTNLIENALNHGRPPILIGVKLASSNVLEVCVQDQGICQFDSLEELSRPFVKGNDSKGTGLGLNIVKKVIEDMGGEISFKKKPTTFILRIKEFKHKEKNV